MGLTAKPTRPSKAEPTIKDVDAFISKGGSVAAEPATPATKAPQHPLKFPIDQNLFSRMEAARKGSTVKLPRNTWILQAIAEKLERDIN